MILDLPGWAWVIGTAITTVGSCMYVRLKWDGINRAIAQMDGRPSFSIQSGPFTRVDVPARRPRKSPRSRG